VRILVFGAGAMGSFFGGLLAARHEVTFIGREYHIDAIRSKGLRITGKTSRITKPRAATRVPRDAKADVVIVSTKAYDTEAAMHQLAPLAVNSLFLTVQNGFDNGDVIARTARRVVVGTTAHGVTFLEPGEIRHAGIGETVIGPWANVGEEDLVRLRDVLDDAGIATRIVSDIRTELWAKVVLNAAYKVHTNLGPGLLESVYQTAMKHVIEKSGVTVKTDVKLPILFEGVKLDSGLQLDMLVEKSVIVELKSVERMNLLYEKQVVTYLRLSHLRLGFLINFNVPYLKDGIRRIVI